MASSLESPMAMAWKSNSFLTVGVSRSLQISESALKFLIKQFARKLFRLDMRRYKTSEKFLITQSVLHRFTFINSNDLFFNRIVFLETSATLVIIIFVHAYNVTMHISTSFIVL